MRNPTIGTTALLLGSLVASACSPLAPIPDRSRFFTLPAAPAAQPDAGTSQRAGRTVYGLGPIILPAYLDRSQVATRLSETEVAYSQWDRWAEPLSTNVSSVLRQRLASELGTEAILGYPWVGGVAVDYQIEVRLLRFESDTTGATHVVARWTIRDAKHDRKVVTKETSLTRPGKPNDTSASTAALSGMLGDLGHEIAAALRDLPSPTRG
jgi:uncharacterized protein